MAVAAVERHSICPPPPVEALSSHEGLPLIRHELHQLRTVTVTGGIDAYEHWPGVDVRDECPRHLESPTARDQPGATGDQVTRDTDFCRLAGGQKTDPEEDEERQRDAGAPHPWHATERSEIHALLLLVRSTHRLARCDVTDHLQKRAITTLLPIESVALQNLLQ